MKLRYFEIDPETMATLLERSDSEIEFQGELALKDLGITRQRNESCLHAWTRTMLDENGSEDSPENRLRLAEAIRQDSDARRFAWFLGGEERRIFGIDDSPELQWYRAERAADRSVMAAFAQAGETRPSSADNPPTASQLGIHWPYILAWSLLVLAMIAESKIVTGVLFVASFMALLAAYIRAQAIRNLLLAKAIPGGSDKWLSRKVWRGEDLFKFVAFATVLVSLGLAGLGGLLVWLARTLPPGAEFLFPIILAVGVGLVILMGNAVRSLFGRIRRALRK